jgi:hypothetical protein
MAHVLTRPDIYEPSKDFKGSLLGGFLARDLGTQGLEMSGRVRT